MTEVRRQGLAGGAAAAIVAALVLTAALGAPQTVRNLVDVHQRYAPLDHTAREQAAGTHEHFGAADWEFLGRGVHRGDTFLVVTPIGPAGGAVGRGFVTRTFANYRLLPAVQVTTRRDANVIVYVDAGAPAQASCASPARTACLLRLRP